MLAVGEHLWGRVDDQVRRMSNALAGGLGCSHEDVCGVMSGGALIIGSLYGRTRPDEDDSECNRLVCLYRDRFVEALGTVRCGDLRASGYGSEGQWPCSTLVEQAVRILMGVLAEGA